MVKRSGLLTRSPSLLPLRYVPAQCPLHDVMDILAAEMTEVKQASIHILVYAKNTHNANHRTPF